MQTYRPTRAPQQFFVLINGLRQHILHWPHPLRPKLLFLHGWMDCAFTFQQVIDFLPTDYEVFALSWRGFGQSDWQEQGYYERMVMLQDLHGVLKHISPNDAIHLIGHSMGSMLATHYSCLFPEKVASLTMAEGFGMPALKNTEQLRQRMRRFVESQTQAPLSHLLSLQMVSDKLIKRNPAMQADFAHFMAQALTRPVDNNQYVYRADPKHDLPQAHPYDWDYLKSLWAHLSMPVLWLEGENLPHNHYLNQLYESLDQRRQLLPNLRQCVTLSGSGHMLQWEAPEAFAKALHDFLRQLDT